MSDGMRRGGRYDTIFYGAYAGNSTFDIRVRFDFKQKLNKKMLQKAANAALRWYPELAVTPVIKEGRVVFRQNRAPVCLAPDDGSLRYFGTEGEQGTNGYLFVFLCGERHLTFSLFHGLTDARGMINFIISTLCYYLSYVFPFMRLISTRSFEKFGVRLSDRIYYTMDDRERYDPLVKYAAEGKPVDLIDVERLFRMPAETFDPADHSCRLLNLELSNREFQAMTKRLKTSYAPLLAAITAEAIASLYDIEDKTISVVATVDSRKFFDTNSVANMAYNCPLPIEKKDLSLPMEELCKKIKADMQLQVTKENAQKTFSFILGQCDDIDNMGNIVDVNRFLSGPDGLKTLTTNGTVFLTYPGRVTNNRISQLLLEGVTPGMLAMERAIVVYAHRDSLIVQITQKSDDLTLINALRATLEKHGFSPKFHDMGRITQNIMDLERLETVDG